MTYHEHGYEARLNVYEVPGEAYEEGSSGRDRNAAQVKAHTHPTISSLMA